MKESVTCFFVRCLVWVLQRLPYPAALGIGSLTARMIGRLNTKNRRVVFSNLTIALGRTTSCAERLQWTSDVYAHLGRNIVDLLRLPRITEDGLSRMIDFEGGGHIQEALKSGRGCILLTIHAGNWELASRFACTLGFPYRIFVRPQPRLKRLESLLHSFRQGGGAAVIVRDSGLRDLVRALSHNEAVSMVVDQGGKSGRLIPFFGRTASLATGAVKMALKSGVPLCFAFIRRLDGIRHHLMVDAPLSLERTGDRDRDIEAALKQIARQMEDHLTRHPAEYLWTYKVWKYSLDRTVLILDDGRTGHLHQSQAAAEELVRLLEGQGYTVDLQTVRVETKGRGGKGWMDVLTRMAKGPALFDPASVLRWCLTPESGEALLSVKPDYVISCGSSGACPNYLLSCLFSSRKIVLQKPGSLKPADFDLALLPRHDLKDPDQTSTASTSNLSVDRHKSLINFEIENPQSQSCQGASGRIVMTHGALNMVTPEYLEEKTRAFVNRFSHLKKGDNPKLGLFVGGDTKQHVLTEQTMRAVISQLRELCDESKLDLLVTTSRRTPVRVETLLQRELKRYARCRILIIANRQNAPEAVGGMMGLCDFLCVSGDSISMISEAASSGKKTVVFPVPTRVPFGQGGLKHERFIHHLSEQNFVLSSEVHRLKASVYSLIKNKILTRQLNDRPRMIEGLKEIL